MSYFSTTSNSATLRSAAANTVAACLRGDRSAKAWRLSLALLTGAALALAIDALTGTVGSTRLPVTTFGDIGEAVFSVTGEANGSSAHAQLSPHAGASVFSTFLRLPIWLLFGVLGAGLALVVRHPSFRAIRLERFDAVSVLTTPRLLSLLMIGVGFGGLAVDLIPGLFSNSGVTVTTVGDLLIRTAPERFVFVRSTEHGILAHFAWALMRMPVWLFVALLGLAAYRISGWFAPPAVAVRPGPEVEAASRPSDGIPSHGPIPSVRKKPSSTPRSELAAVLLSFRRVFLGIGLISGVGNVLMLTGAFFMLQVYDRVLPSRSVPTLVVLAILAFGLFAVQGILDMVRSRVLSRVGASLDEALSGRIYDIVVRLPLRVGGRGEGLQPLRDLDAIRTFLSGQGPTALFDLPWMPVYLAIIFAFHPLLGMTALGGACVLVALTVLTEMLTREPMNSTTASSSARLGLASASRRNAEVVAAMGMTGRMRARWFEANQDYLRSNQAMSDVTGGFGAMSRSLRMILQSGVLGVGAYLVINGQATAGIIIAGSILVSRAMAPVDLAIANWRGFVSARQSRQRLTTLLEKLPPQPAPMELPVPSRNFSVEAVSAVPPGETKVVVRDVSFVLERGRGLGIIGPSGSGKSSLARLLVGVWQPVHGRVRLDGASLAQWSPESLGKHVGYLPQDVELFAGTIAENISRFDPQAEPKAIIAAAKAAGAHELIVGLPSGYETELGENGEALSGGQRQRVALARALYGDPFLVVLDEPNSNLDGEGEAALTQALLSVRSRGGIVVIVAHRPSALAGVDRLMVMNQGRAVAFGPKDEVLERTMRSSSAATPQPLKIVPSGANTP